MLEIGMTHSIAYNFILFIHGKETAERRKVAHFVRAQSSELERKNNVRNFFIFNYLYCAVLEEKNPSNFVRNVFPSEFRFNRAFNTKKNPQKRKCKKAE